MGKVGSRWEEERRVFFLSGGWNLDETGDENGNTERQRVERWEKIGDSRYNRWYKEVRETGVPEYLKKGWAREQMK